MWVYVQRTGELVAPDGEVVAIGYAGAREHKNRPESERVRNLGPLPQGVYEIGPPRATQDHGPYVLRLTPAPLTVMHGRAGFLIHGDSTSRPGTASEGCVILHRTMRERIWQSGDRRLRVIADRKDV